MVNRQYEAYPSDRDQGYGGGYSAAGAPADRWGGGGADYGGAAGGGRWGADIAPPSPPRYGAGGGSGAGARDRYEAAAAAPAPRERYPDRYAEAAPARDRYAEAPPARDRYAEPAHAGSYVGGGGAGGLHVRDLKREYGYEQPRSVGAAPADEARYARLERELWEREREIRELRERERLLRERAMGPPPGAPFGGYGGRDLPPPGPYGPARSYGRDLPPPGRYGPPPAGYGRSPPRRRSLSPRRKRTRRSRSPRGPGRAKLADDEELGKLEVTAEQEELFKTSVVDLMSRRRLPVNISVINDIMRGKEKNWNYRNVPNCRSFRIFCQLMEKRGWLRMQLVQETVQISGSDLAPELPPDAVVEGEENGEGKDGKRPRGGRRERDRKRRERERVEGGAKEGGEGGEKDQGPREERSRSRSASRGSGRSSGHSRSPSRGGSADSGRSRSRSRSHSR